MKTRKENSKMNETQKKSINIKDVIETHSYNITKCADNLDTLASAIHQSGDHVYANGVEAIAEFLRIVSDDLMNNVWPNLKNINNEN